MNNMKVRITSIEITHFKNVGHGIISLVNQEEKYKASVLGLYGQNGSGKSALIDALNVLKCALCGVAIPGKYAEYVSVEASYSVFRFGFRIESTDEKSHYEAIYEFKLKKEYAPIAVVNGLEQIAPKAVIFDEFGFEVIVVARLAGGYFDGYAALSLASERVVDFHQRFGRYFAGEIHGGFVAGACYTIALHLILQRKRKGIQRNKASISGVKYE